MSKEAIANKHLRRAEFARKAQDKYNNWGGLMSGVAFAEGLMTFAFPPAAIAGVISMADSIELFRRAARAGRVATRETVLYEQATKPIKVTTQWSK